MAFSVLSVLTPLITSPIISRALGAEKLGIYSATLAVASYFKIFAMLGVEAHGNRAIAAAQGDRARIRSLFWNIYAIQFAASLLSVLAYAALFLFISPERRVITLIQGLQVLNAFLNINWLFYGLEQFRLTAIRSIFCKILAVALVALFIRKPEDLPIYALIIAGDMLISNLIMWPFLRKNVGFELPRWKKVRRHILPLLILFLPSLAFTLFHLMDKIMLDWLSIEREVGFYYNADKMTSIPSALITALNAVMLPKMAHTFHAETEEKVRQLLKKSTELTICLFGAVGVGVAAIAREFVPFFFGPGFEPCVLLLYWFIPVMFVKAISALIRSQYMIPTHMDKEYTLSIFGGALLNLIVNFPLIRKYGSLGAVWGTLIAESVVAILEIFYTMRKIPFIRYMAQSFPYAFLAAVMFLSVRWVSSRLAQPALLKLICMVGTGGLVYFSLCAVYWRLNPKSLFH